MRALVLGVLVACSGRGGHGQRDAAAAATVVAAVDAGCGSLPPTQVTQAPRGGQSESAGMSFQTYLAMQPLEGYIAQTKYDVVLATVDAILSSHAATNADPPEVRLRIDEVLRGDPAVDRTRTLWRGPGPGDNRDDNDTGDVEYGKELQKQYEAALAAWKKATICPPSVGEQFVLLGQVDKTGMFVHVADRRVPATPATIAQARHGLVLDAAARSR